jgi:hypothetical protein
LSFARRCRSYTGFVLVPYGGASIVRISPRWCE